MSIMNHLGAATVQLHNLSKRFEINSFDACAFEEHLGVIVKNQEDYNKLLDSPKCKWSSASRLSDGSGVIYQMGTEEYPLLKITCVVYD